MLAGRGEAARRLEHYTRALHIAERLAEADPDNPTGCATCRSASTRVGDVLAGRGEAARRLQHYTRALHIAERSAGTDPDNTDWQRNLSIRLERVGDVLAGRGEAGAAPTALHPGPAHRRAADRGRPAQHRPAARPVGQPRPGWGMCWPGAARRSARARAPHPGPAHRRAA